MRHRNILAAATLAAALAGLNAAPAQAQLDLIRIDTDGALVGVFTGDVFVGSRTQQPITVFADSATDVSGTLETHNQARLVMADGFAERLLLRDESRLEMHNGFIPDGLTTLDHSVADVSFGFFGFFEPGDGVDAFGQSRINFHSGVVFGDVTALDESTINLFGGGVLGSVAARQNATVNLTGGGLTGDLVLFDAGTIHITGQDLAVEFRETFTGGSTFLLTGTLLDGTPINNFAQVFDGANLQLNNVPEPGATALCAGLVAGAALLRRRRASSERRGQ